MQVPSWYNNPIESGKCGKKEIISEEERAFQMK